LPTDPQPRKREGLLARLDRKRRALLGSIVSGIIGDGKPGEDSLAPPGETARKDLAGPGPKAEAPSSGPGIKAEIVEAGLIGGLANRVKKTADLYLNQKLDEIEQRIDRKLDEIDRRLAEWRDKEIANRLRIIKITLWASVIVGAFSLAYSYVKVYLLPPSEPAGISTPRH